MMKLIPRSAKKVAAYNVPLLLFQFFFFFRDSQQTQHNGMKKYEISFPHEFLHVYKMKTDTDKPNRRNTMRAR